MAKKAARTVQADVVVLGCHPSAFLAVALLKQIAGLEVVHASLAGEKYVDRLVLLNPRLFDLHPLLNEVRDELALTPTYGLRFLGDDREVENGFTSKNVTAFVASFKQVQSVLQKRAGIQAEAAPNLDIHSVDETGVDLSLGRNRLRTKLILLAGPVEPAHRAILGLPEKWDAEVVHRYSFIKCKAPKLEAIAQSGQPILPMSLDLAGTLHWAWLMAAGEFVQLAIEQPGDRQAGNAHRTQPASAMLQHWADVLSAHGLLKHARIDAKAVTTLELPFGGALAQDLVANRTLLFGPAGGFYSACAEEMYPCCWSAIFAVAAAKAALKERFVQDALQVYRQKWGGTLGDYLRGPQQNLKFLLPLVYRNPTMAARLAEAILLGESVVR